MIKLYITDFFDKMSSSSKTSATSKDKGGNPAVWVVIIIVERSWKGHYIMYSTS